MLGVAQVKQFMRNHEVAELGFSVIVLGAMTCLIGRVVSSSIDSLIEYLSR